jgi:hypothetical protein
VVADEFWTSSEPSAQSAVWAPWWLYVAIIVPTNWSMQQLLLPADATWWYRAAMTATSVVVNIAVITAIYRALRLSRPRSS